MAETASAATLDFTNVKDGGNYNTKRVPMGDYEARITKVVDAPTKKKDDGTGGEPQWAFTLELTRAYTDRKFPYRCKLTANQLWKIRNLFIAAGKAIPKKKVKLNPNIVIGKLVGVTLEDDEYDGKLQSVIAQIFPAADLNDDQDTEDEDQDYEDGEGDEEEEEPEPAPRARRKKAAPAPVDDEEDDEDEEEGDDEEEEEEEPQPKAKIPAQRRSSPAAKRPAKKAAAKIEVDDDELEELDLDEI